MRPRQNPGSSSIENEEVSPDNLKFMAKYWQYFPRIGFSPSSLPEAIIYIIGIILIAFVYSFIYIGFVTFRRLVRAIKDFFIL
jgi:hypothetical protein